MGRRRHASSVTGTLGGAPYGATKRVRGVPKKGGGGGPHANCATGALGGAPYGATKRVRGVPKLVAGTHANRTIWALGGAPYGATNRVRGVPKWAGNRMWTLPLGPSAELHVGPRTA